MYGIQHGGTGLGDGTKEWTKAEAELIDPKLKEPVTVYGPAYTCKFLTIKAETAAQAALFVNKKLGLGGAVTGVFTKAVESGAGTQPKVIPTVKEAEWAEASPL